MTNLSTLSFIHIFRRFIARRAIPHSILSDNTAQFKLASEIFQGKLFPSPDLSTIQWKLIVELSPWQGGIYERMVSTFKNALRFAIGKQLLTLESIITHVTEAEMIVNSRPLTYITEDPNFVPILPLDILIPGIGTDSFSI